MHEKQLLLADGLINALLGWLLVIFPGHLAEWMGLPIPEEKFYNQILGAVLIGSRWPCSGRRLRSTVLN